MRGWNEELGLAPTLPHGHRTGEGAERDPKTPGDPQEAAEPWAGSGWGMACGNGASGNQRDLLGYTLNPPHKRGLFVGTGCRWLSHTCLASRAWRIKDNWFSPDRKHQEC